MATKMFWDIGWCRIAGQSLTEQDNRENKEGVEGSRVLIVRYKRGREKGGRAQFLSMRVTLPSSHLGSVQGTRETNKNNKRERGHRREKNILMKPRRLATLGGRGRDID